MKKVLETILIFNNPLIFPRPGLPGISNSKEKEYQVFARIIILWDGSVLMLYMKNYERVAGGNNWDFFLEGYSFIHSFVLFSF